ncbi:MAG TPA: DUF4845 domain-containing protein [Candidatus Angelobacter sp.]|jgi:hypothetical protein|nr:DUF4845 domain-containing protein [Candidatus Angelobacter sp.]
MGKLKGLIGILIVVGIFYAAWNLIPPYFNNYQLQDALDDIARKNSYTQSTDEEIRKSVVKKAETEDIPLREDQVVVTRSQDGLGITVKYRIHVEMVVHPVDLDFTAASLNKRI